MTEDRTEAPWPRCQADPGCAGSALPPWGRCPAHLAPDDLEQAIKRAKTEGLDARGVTVTPSLFERISSLLDRSDQDRLIVPNVQFDEATFTGRAWFDEATFSGDAGFDAVSLSGRLSFLRVRAAKRLQLALRDDSIGEVDLTEASFAGPAVLTASLRGASIRRPRLLSLVQADTTNLTVAGLDLSTCRFLGAIHLEQLRIDGPLLLGEAPGWWRARRRVLWEEGELRSWPDWATPDRQDGPEADPHWGERASRLQAVYRELRKGREDAKDEPGAADFYYGEMEMRRQAARGVERWLLTGYWAVSGYGLRGSGVCSRLTCTVAGWHEGAVHERYLTGAGDCSVRDELGQHRRTHRADVPESPRYG